MKLNYLCVFTINSRTQPKRKLMESYESQDQLVSACMFVCVCACRCVRLCVMINWSRRWRWTTICSFSRCYASQAEQELSLSLSVVLSSLALLVLPSLSLFITVQPLRRQLACQKWGKKHHQPKPSENPAPFYLFLFFLPSWKRLSEYLFSFWVWLI